MYYKITNKKSEVYKKLHKLRSEELQFEKDNRKTIEELTKGLEWDSFWGHKGQQTLNRVTEYMGFVFKNTDKVDSKVWRKHKDNLELFVPNKRTKDGREISKILRNKLKGNSFFSVFDALGVDSPSGKFSFPYVEIVDDVIVMYMDESFQPEDYNIIEITSKEFEKIRDNLKV